MKKTDFPAIRLMHMSWKQRLTNFLNGKESETAEHLSHNKCDLGIWIYSDGMAKYGRMPEMQELEKTHKEMHSVVERVVNMKRTGSLSAIEQELSKIEHLSQRLYSLLIIIEDRFDLI
jgi:methyl-accepting chemotaxis protein